MSDKTFGVLNNQSNWQNLYFYQKADVVYQLSVAFCNRFIHLYKDRTRDQMIQAARSCKQNIVEGLADGVTSSETQIKLLNVARASLMELQEDFEDYIKAHHLAYYVKGTEVYDVMVGYCRPHNKLEDYAPFFEQWTDEQMCNYGITLCRMTDRMLMSYLQKLEKSFVTDGGMRERMHRVRTGYRQKQMEQIESWEKERDCLLKERDALRAERDALRTERDGLLKERDALRTERDGLRTERDGLLKERDALRTERDGAAADAARWHADYDDLKQRALHAYYQQREEIARLKQALGKE